VVLAMLLLRPGRIVGTGELIEAVWDDEPPATARGQLQTCVSRLRRTLPAGTIRTDPAGYGIQAADLDAIEFARLVEAARTATDPEAARRDYRRALDLWRGPALVEIDSLAVRRAAGTLDERLAVVTEDWVDLELTAGRERDLIGELTGLVERFPLRERLRGQLMVSLYRSGRQADALAEYARARAVLRDELGIDPGSELRAVHRHLLDGTLAAGDRPALGPTATTTGPAERVRYLPRTVADFTGRAEVVERLLKAIEASGPAGPAVAMIDGMAGSGKTTLAVHLATLVEDRYPDAHLFVDLLGHSAEQPLDPAAALLILLRQLGVTAEQVPPDLIGRIGLWRTELARRRALVIFDNAASSAQLAELTAMSPGSLALVTSRRRLTGLDGVHPESLPVLDEDEAIELLARIAGERVREEPEAAAAVVQRCGRLALAIRLAGARLAHRPRWRVADLLSRLGGAVLPELVAENRNLAGAFALSYGQLTDPLQRTFRLLGCYPGADFDAVAVAALTRRTLPEARDLLDDLVDIHLVEEPEPGVYRLHDLLREFAAVLAHSVPPDERREAVIAVADLQLHALAATVSGPARQTLDRHLKSRRPLREDLVPAVPDPAARLERERGSLAAFVEAAVVVGRTDYAWQIPRAAWWHLFRRGYDADIAELCHRALVITERAGDRYGQAVIANYLSSAYARRTDNDRSRHYLQLSIRLYEEAGDLKSLVNSLNNLASLDFMADRFAESVRASDAAFRMSVRARDGSDARLRWNNLATPYARLGRNAEALRYYRLQLSAASEQGDRELIGTSLVSIQGARRDMGTMSIALAWRYLRAAMRVFERESLAFCEADVHVAMARLLRAEGRYQEAVAAHRRALDIMRGLSDRRMRPEFLHELGTTLRLSGDLAAARPVFEESLRLGRAIPLPYQVAVAEAGLAECLAGTDPAEARRLRARAYEAFSRLGTPERFEVLEHLRSSTGGGTMEA
jgi:DNA-binding SARP family transcriptional activator/tetratricopeptide (TPR) repeat protein